MPDKRIVVTQKRFLLVDIEVDKRGMLVPFEIPIPDNVTTITGISAIGTLTGATLTPIQTTRHYFGVAVQPVVFDNAFVQTLVFENIKNKNKVFSDNANATEYFYYARPKRLGPVYFAVDGVNGGFTLITGAIVAVIDPDNGFTEDYYVYESNYENLGTITVAVR